MPMGIVQVVDEVQVRVQILDRGGGGGSRSASIIDILC